MPTARRCQGCGATLGEPAAGASVVTCQFCGLAHDTTVAFPAFRLASVTIETPAHVRRARRIVWIVAAIVIVAVTVSAVVPALMGLRIAQSAIGRAVPDVTARLNDHRRPTAPADLSTAPTSGGWKVLATSPPVDSFANFDPIASLP